MRRTRRSSRSSCVPPRPSLARPLSSQSSVRGRASCRQAPGRCWRRGAHIARRRGAGEEAAGDGGVDVRRARGGHPPQALRRGAGWLAAAVARGWDAWAGMIERRRQRGARGKEEEAAPGGCDGWHSPLRSRSRRAGRVWDLSSARNRCFLVFSPACALRHGAPSAAPPAPPHHSLHTKQLPCCCTRQRRAPALSAHLPPAQRQLSAALRSPGASRGRASPAARAPFASGSAAASLSAPRLRREPRCLRCLRSLLTQRARLSTGRRSGTPSRSSSALIAPQLTAESWPNLQDRQPRRSCTGSKRPCCCARAHIVFTSPVTSTTPSRTPSR